MKSSCEANVDLAFGQTKTYCARLCFYPEEYFITHTTSSQKTWILNNLQFECFARYSTQYIYKYCPFGKFFATFCYASTGLMKQHMFVQYHNGIDQMISCLNNAWLIWIHPHHTICTVYFEPWSADQKYKLCTMYYNVEEIFSPDLISFFLCFGILRLFCNVEYIAQISLTGL